MNQRESEEAAEFNRPNLLRFDEARKFARLREKTNHAP
jgi:hypothetical protein